MEESKGLDFGTIPHIRRKISASQAGLRNCYDGSVEMEVQGDPNKINDLILYLQAQRFIQIEEMDEKKIPLQEEETAFRERW